jgi:hypothetical protein
MLARCASRSVSGMDEIAQDVAAAAKLMDERKPGWFRRIVWRRLNMQDECNCIAGQAGLDWDELDDEFSSLYPRSVTSPFAAKDTVPAWKTEVRARRASA